MTTAKRQALQILALSANLAGGKTAGRGGHDQLGEYLKHQDVDFVCCQEAAMVHFDDGVQRDMLRDVVVAAGEGRYLAHFAPSVDTTNHPCPELNPGKHKPAKWYAAIYFDNGVAARYAAQGNGILVSAKWEAMDLFGGTRQRTMATVAISNPELFLGDRETEPRIMSLLRVRHKELGTECIVANTHLTTLRKKNELRRGSKTRLKQTRNILRVFRQLPKGIPIILGGDFNAELRSPEMKLLEDAGFPAATERCSKADKRAGTHRGKSTFIDHFFYSGDMQIKIEQCVRLDLGEEVSDHAFVQFSFTVPLTQ